MAERKAFREFRKLVEKVLSGEMQGSETDKEMARLFPQFTPEEVEEARKLMFSLLGCCTNPECGFACPRECKFCPMCGTENVHFNEIELIAKGNSFAELHTELCQGDHALVLSSYLSIVSSDWQAWYCPFCGIRVLSHLHRLHR
ncbi:MAG: hypothetical protein G01um101466_55 [Parcubacteria group bacterium Gr01-1014_66]|nr:MAG: hypothetical protein G01um101466_55 [Parcubacteria group bacterium Gr01-1014_66]